MTGNLLESQGFLIFLAVSSIISLIFGLLGTIIGLMALVKVIATEKSTHSVTYMPIDDEIDKANKEFTKNWATKASTIAEDQQLFKEDLEIEMPDFFPDEEESKIRSF